MSMYLHTCVFALWLENVTFVAQSETVMLSDFAFSAHLKWQLSGNYKRS